MVFLSIPAPIKPPSPTRPAAPQPDRSNKPVDRKPSGTSFSNPTLKSPIQSPRIVLPENYEKMLHPETQRFYYINHNDKTTSWNPPAGKI